MPSILIIPIVIVVILLGLTVYAKANRAKLKGKAGEARVHMRLMALPDEYHLFDNVVLLTEHGTTQIDHIVVSRYGVFAIETKNYRGSIYGKDDDTEWKQIIKTDVRYSRKWWKTYTYITKNKLYNPVKQSKGHAYNIRKKLKDFPHLPIIPLVVFSNEADLSGVKTKEIVINENDLLDVLKTYRNIYLSESDLYKVIECISIHDSSLYIDNKTHIRNVRLAKSVSETKSRLGICPKCGGSLVLRNGRYGNFYGCSNYPKCKYTQRD